jgi:hypothetical protein
MGDRVFRKPDLLASVPASPSPTVAFRSAIMPSGEVETVYGFATEAEAAKWIGQESQAWLYESKAPRAKIAN